MVSSGATCTNLPVGWTWPHKKGVTLLGYAAHAITLFAGIGVNTAFHGAVELVKQIIASTRLPEAADLDGYIIRYEKTMLEHTPSSSPY